MSTSTVSLGQTVCLLKMIQDKEVPQEQLQALFTTGLLADLLDANVGNVKRDAFRHLLGLKPLSVLGTRIAVVIDTIKGVDLDTFYQSRKGLRVWPSFTDDIVTVAKKDKRLVSLNKLWHRDLTQDALDSQIEQGLRKNHQFSELEVAMLLSQLIVKQQNGEDGLLQNNGRANLFYTKRRVVCVYWHSDARKWYVISYARDVNTWDVGYRVFSRN